MPVNQNRTEKPDRSSLFLMLQVWGLHRQRLGPLFQGRKPGIADTRIPAAPGQVPYEPFE